MELEPDLEGLLHISEIADHKIDSPQDVVKPAQEIEVKILRVDSDSRKIGLSMRRVKWAEKDQKPSALPDKPAEKPQSDPQTKEDGLDGLQIPQMDIPQETEGPNLPDESKDDINKTE